ncbi:MAG: hypothetical protein H0X71_03750, partial [Rubrobacter sp.]|nr:hypothetical protein [Rubrobacter sp.]
VTLSEPFTPFLAVLTDRAGIMASPKAIEESNGRISDKPVGTGPFEFVERVRGDSITLKKNQDYWRDGFPKVNKIVYSGIDDENVQYQNLQSGELDIIERYDRKLWIGDFLRSVVYLPFEQSNGRADAPTSAGRTHRCEGYIRTTRSARNSSSCPILTRSPEQERGGCSSKPSRPRSRSTSKPPGASGTREDMP